jgi:hypothetical protein
MVIVLNDRSGVHAARPGEACTAGAQVTLVLDRPSGTLQFGDRTVYFEVTAGWPEWEPESSPAADA